MFLQKLIRCHLRAFQYTDDVLQRICVYINRIIRNFGVLHHKTQNFGLVLISKRVKVQDTSA